MSSVPYRPLRVREATLPNGLRVLLCERRGHPVVACMVWYRVGSRDEVAGKTGISHFLEHLTFKGSRRFGKGVIDAITARFGGSNNGFTDTDCTAYVFSFASDRWRPALEIEAERMRDCLLDPVEFEAERRVVLEEMRMARDEPWRDLYQEATAALFVQHPYRQPVIGWESDVQGVGREAVRGFYRRHYRPDNATVVLVGDFDAREALARVRRAFGGLRGIARPGRRGGEREEAVVPEPPQRGERRVTIERPDAVARLLVGFRTCRVGDRDDAVLDAVGSILVGGKSSRFYRRLVLGRGIATQVAAENDTRRDPGVFWLSLEVRPGIPPARAERALLAEIDRIARDGPTASELARAKRSLVASVAFERESAADIAENLGRCEVQADWRFVNRYVPEVLRLSVGRVREAAARYFPLENRVVALARPLDRKSRRSRAVPDASGPGSRPAPRASTVPRGRSATPPPRFPSPPRGSPIVSLRETRTVFENGLVLLVVRNSVAPTLTAAAFVEAGLACEPERLAGLAHLAGALLDEGTRKWSGPEIADAVESVGGSVDTGLGGLSISLPSEHVSLALEFLAGMLVEPTYPKGAVRRRRDLLLGEILGEEDDTRAWAYQRLREAVYRRHPLHRPVKGYGETVRRIRREHVAAFHRRTFGPDRTIVAVSGDVDPREVVGRLRRSLGRWRASPEPIPKCPTVRLPRRGREILIDEPRAQVQAVLGHAGIARNDPDFYPLLLLDHVLGSGTGFTDRLSRRLRDERGLAYSVHADVTSSAGKEPGIFAASIGTAAETFRPAVEGIRAEIRRILREPPTAEELRAAKDYLLGSYVFGLERNAGRALFLLQRERFGLGEDFLDRYPALIEGVTREQVVKAARRRLHPASLTLVAVGPVRGRA